MPLCSMLSSETINVAVVILTIFCLGGIYVGTEIDHQNLSGFLSEKKVNLKFILNDVVFSFED